RTSTTGNFAKTLWQPGWRPLPTMDNMPIESRLYSDGLFSFSVNVNRATPSSTDQMLRTGRRTVSTSVRDNAELNILGNAFRRLRRQFTDNGDFG
ncbi:MucB/RseB C-terminal domain-containing protein, partial [Escherichia sp. TWPC-MK]